MADEVGAVAVLDAQETPVNDDISSQEPTQSTDTPTEKVSRETEQPEKPDGRRQPDALRKHIADLRKQAEAITDPTEKKAALDRIKLLYDTSGKARGYEEQFPTVREAREVKALLDAVGGREGFQQMQATLESVAAIDEALSAGDVSVVDKLWQEAPDGMPKLVPAIIDRFQKENPDGYAKAMLPHTLNIIEQNGFLVSVGSILQELQQDKPSADAIWKIAKGMKDWFESNRGSIKEAPKPDPEVERLRSELAKRDQVAESQAVDAAYNAVVTAAWPAIDQAAKQIPSVAKMKLEPAEYKVFRDQVWDHLQNARNSDPTYKTVARAKAREGYDKWTEYANRWTSDNAETSIRAILKTPPWSRLAATSAPAVTATRQPGAPAGVTQGKEPAPSEIDYSGKGLQVARKAGFKDIAYMILSGQAPLKAGGIRKWR